MNKTQSHEWHLFLNALMFYSRIRIPENTPYSPELLNQSRKYFTVVGLIVGAICALVFAVTQTVLPTSMAVLLSMLAGILTTGAFHEDGFADTCDALGGGWHAEHILTIMKDSRIGTYGTVGLVGMLGSKYLLLHELSHVSLGLWCLCVISAHAISRHHSSRMVKRYQYVQDSDLSKVKPIAAMPLSQSAEHFSMIVAFSPCALLIIYSPWIVMLGLVVSYGSADLFMRYCEKRIGGYTGDVLGAIQQLSEVAFLLICVAALV